MSQYQFVKDVEVCLRNHEVYHSKEDVMNKIKENEREIAKRKQMLFGMVCGNISELYPQKREGDWSSLEQAQAAFEVLFDEEDFGIENLVAHNVDLWYIYNNFDRAVVG